MAELPGTDELRRGGSSSPAAPPHATRGGPAAVAPRPGETGFLARHVVLPFAVWAVVAAVLEWTRLDLVLSDPFYDAQSGAWLGLHDPFVGHVLYYGGRYLIVAVGVLLLAVWAASFRVARLASWRRAALYVVLCMAATATVVDVLKRLIDRGTPADYDRYGGPRPWVPLFASVPPGFESAHQFPAAHPSGAFALLALYLVARTHGARRPALWLLPGAALGTLFSFVQQIRGMHFASHDWWTLGIAWGVAVGMFRLFRGRV